MAKRIRDSVTEGKPKATGPATLEGIDTNELARERSGMVPDQWNAAIRLQCAVRELLERPVTLVEALEFARQAFSYKMIIDSAIVGRMRKDFDTARRLEAETKNAAADADRKNAGRK